MTNKSLSEQICELCEIKPLQGYNLSTINENGLHPETEVYPDLQHNINNFMKLLCLYTDYITKNNIKIPCKTIWWILNKDAQTYNQLAPYDIDLCLIRLLIILKNKNNEYSEEEINKIKQAIRQADWEV